VYYRNLFIHLFIGHADNVIDEMWQQVSRRWFSERDEIWQLIERPLLYTTAKIGELSLRDPLGLQTTEGCKNSAFLVHRAR